MYSHKKIILKTFFLFSFLLGLFIFSGVFGSANYAQAALSCQIRNGVCVGAEAALLRMSDTTNAHAGFEGISVYPYRICCEDDAGVVTISNSCAAPSDVFLHLSAPDNAHVEKESQVNYINNACINVSTGVVNCFYQNGACATGTCLASISADTNAHIGNCVAYNEKVCCKITPPPTCNLTPSSASINFGDSIDLTWNTTDSTSASIDGVGVAPVNAGVKNITPLDSATYTMTVTGDGGTATCQTTVTVVHICGDGFISGPEFCDTLGNINCDGSRPVCNSDCSDCTCLFAGDLVWAGNFLGVRQPIMCIILDLIMWILSIVGKVSLLVLIFGGIFYVVSGSNPEKQEKAKKTIVWALLGLALVLASHAIIVIMNKIFVQA